MLSAKKMLITLFIFQINVSYASMVTKDSTNELSSSVTASDSTLKEKFFTLLGQLKSASSPLLDKLYSIASQGYQDMGDLKRKIFGSDIEVAEAYLDPSYQETFLLRWFDTLSNAERTFIVATLTSLGATANLLYSVHQAKSSIAQYNSNKFKDVQNFNKSDSLNVESISSIILDPLLEDAETKNLLIVLKKAPEYEDAQYYSYSIISNNQSVLEKIVITNDNGNITISRKEMDPLKQFSPYKIGSPTIIEIQTPYDIVQTNEINIILDRYTTCKVEEGMDNLKNITFNLSGNAQVEISNIIAERLTIEAKDSTIAQMSGTLKTLFIQSKNAAQVINSETQRTSPGKIWGSKTTTSNTYLNTDVAKIYASDQSVIVLGTVNKTIFGVINDSAQLEYTADKNTINDKRLSFKKNWRGKPGAKNRQE